MDGYVVKSWNDISLWQGDCLQLMHNIEDKSIDLIIADLPYGSTDCDWDNKINLSLFWERCNRIITDSGCIALTSSQPFTTDLINSNRKMFRYCWIWDKKKGGNIMNCKYQPYKVHEEIVIFSKSTASRSSNVMNYYPIMEEAKRKRVAKNYKKSEIYAKANVKEDFNKLYTQTYPKSIVTISNSNQHIKVHPTQKPVELFEYIIKTYTSEGMKILDPCCGSGTSLEACFKLKRKAIGMELESKYIDLIASRINNITMEK